MLDEAFINHGNINCSSIKTAIDNWYSTNMTSCTSKLEDTPWCNGISNGSISVNLGYGGASYVFIKDWYRF